MNFKLIIFLVLVTLLSNISHAQYDSISFGGYERNYLVHLPIGYTGATNLPLVIAMHGGAGNAYNMEKISELSIKADNKNFIVLYPEGVKGGFFNISSWNAGWCCGFASRSNIDDVGFIDSLLNKVTNKYSIDTNRIYATGMSNGGFMSYRLACELSNRIAAIAPVECTMTMESCTPNRAVPIIHFHSYLDTNIPHDGGIGDGPSNHYNPPVDSVLNVWATNNSCDTLNNIIINNDQYTLTKWTGCNCKSEIHYYITQDGGHAWPGVGGSEFINATDLMWNFFQQYSLDCDTTTSVEKPVTKSDSITVYPNPTSGKLKIYSGIEYNNLEISLFTILGKNVLISKNKLELDISSLATGTYFIRIKMDEIIKIVKVIKIE